MKAIIFYLWLIAGILTLCSDGDVSKLTYTTCWLTLMLNLGFEVFDDVRKDD